MVAVPVPVVGDEELAEAAAAGDEEAFADLRQRYAGAVYDLLARMTRSRADAAALTRVTFERARRGLSDRRPEGRLRPWLYAIARQAAIDAIRRRLEISVADGAAMTGLEDSEVESRAVVEDVWRAAAALSPDEYAALHYQLRAGLDTGEIAEAMSLPTEAVHTALIRAREGLDDAFALLQLARRDRRACGGLELLVGFHAPIPLDPATRRAFRRHLEGCAKCRHRRAQLVAPSGVLSALRPVAPPKYLRIAHNARPLSGAQQSPARRHGVRHWATPAVAMAGLALVALFLVSRGPRPDRTPPAEPQQVMSTTHVPWVASSHRSVEVLWSGAADRPTKGERDSGVAGYSVSWSGAPGDVPDDSVRTSDERASSPELDEGIWWFHLRTVDRAGNATPPVHLGPFVIAEPRPAPAPASATTPTVRRPGQP